MNTRIDRKVFDSIVAKYELIYQETYNTTNRTALFFRRHFNIKLILDKHTPSKIKDDKDGICLAIQSALYDLKQKSAHMSWLSRWLIGLNPMIAQCEKLLKEAYAVRNIMLLKKMNHPKQPEYKGSSTLSIIKQEIKKGTYVSLSDNLVKRFDFIKSIIEKETKETIPTEKINYFNRGAGFPFRYVHPRVSGGKTKSYVNLKAEIKASDNEINQLRKNRPQSLIQKEIEETISIEEARCFNRDWDLYKNFIDETRRFDNEINRLRKNHPSNNSSNRIDANQNWSDDIDDCEARSNYAKSEIRKMTLQKREEIIFDNHGKPSVAILRR